MNSLEKMKNIAKILNCFYDDPILSINEIQEQTKLGRSTIERIIRALQQKKYVSEITNFQRNKHYEIGRASCRERV